MSGASFNCPTCNAYLGRGKARVQAHKVPEDCIRLLEREIAIHQASTRLLENHLLTLKRIEDSQAGGPYPRIPYQVALHTT